MFRQWLSMPMLFIIHVQCINDVAVRSSGSRASSAAAVTLGTVRNRAHQQQLQHIVDPDVDNGWEFSGDIKKNDQSLNQSFATEDKIYFDEAPVGPSCADIEVFIKAHKTCTNGDMCEEDSVIEKAVRALEFCAEHDNNIDDVTSFGLPPLNALAQNLSRRVQFVHVSKTAGTWLCACANKNGQNRGLKHDETKNCHFLDEDKPMWGWDQNVPSYAKIPRKDPHLNNCQKLAAKYRRRGITFEGDENYLGNYGRLCSNLYVVMVVRQPIQRIISNLVQMLGENKTKKLSVSNIFNKWPIISDNYVTRVLGGNDVFRLGFGKITAKHRDHAIHLLSQFNAVFVMTGPLSPDVKARFGWSCQDVSGRVSTASGGTQALLNYFERTRGDWYRMEQQNVHDMALFKRSQLYDFMDRINYQNEVVSKESKNATTE